MLEDDMFCDVIGALNSYYQKDTDVLIQCIMWLKNNLKNNYCAYDWLIKHNICPDCGHKMVAHMYREPIPYGDTCVFEEMYEAVCPQCMGGNQNDK